jgi:hypothetical protein
MAKAGWFASSKRVVLGWPLREDASGGELRMGSFASELTGSLVNIWINMIVPINAQGQDVKNSKASHILVGFFGTSEKCIRCTAAPRRLYTAQNPCANVTQEADLHEKRISPSTYDGSIDTAMAKEWACI